MGRRLAVWKKGSAVLATAVLIFARLDIASAAAPPASDSTIVNATNDGVVQFDILLPTYTFGTVDANGTASVGGTQALTGVRSATGATYTALTATTWRAASAPPATIYIFNASGTSIINWGTADRLRMRILTTSLSAGSVSCGYKSFTTVGDGGSGACGSGNLVRNVLVRNGGNAAVGNLDFELFVADADLPGDNTWAVTITEVGL